MKHLIVVAAPSCCGKSEFVRKLQHGDLPEISESLGIKDFSNWRYQDSYYVTNETIRELESSPVENMLLHWTIAHPTLRLMLRNFLLLLEYDTRARINLIKSASNVTSLTLYADSDTLLARVLSRKKRIEELREERSTSLIEYWRQVDAIRVLKKFYSGTQKMKTLYKSWFGFCDQFNFDQHYMVDVSGSPKLHSYPDSKDIIESW